MPKAQDTSKYPERRKRGFEMTSGLLQSRIRKATEARGFAESRLLTHWSEVVGEATAAMARPVSVSYAKDGFGATLTLLTTGAFAPMLQAELPKIKDRVNAVYGYSAISRLRITQTAPTGFSEGRVQFEQKKAEKPFEPTPEVRAEAQFLSADVKDEKLRKALENMANNVLSRTDPTAKKVDR